MAVKTVIFDGSSKKLLKCDREDQIVLEFLDGESVFDNEKKAKFKKKGVLRKSITEAVFSFLDSYNIPNHFIKAENERGLRVRKLDMIPMAVVIRNVASGNLCRRFKIKEGMALKYPVIEYYLKDDELNNPFIAESHAYAFEYAAPEEMKHIARLASKVNAVLKSFLERRKLKLISYKLEFGRWLNQIYLGDEISPDTSNLWHIDEDNGLDKKYYNFENNGANEAYNEIYQRILGK